MYICQYEEPVRYEWDDEKNRCNISKHGIDFMDAALLFESPVLMAQDDRFMYSEERWIAIGWLRSLLGVVVYTERTANVIRIISARKATSQEIRLYAKFVKH